MNRILIAFVFFGLLANGCGRQETPAAKSQAHGSDAKQGGHDEAAKGPHGGRLLEDGDFSLEVTIFERGVPPEFQVYAYRDHKSVAPAEVTLAIELSRLGGVVDRHVFAARNDYLVSGAEVYEPHSFDVRISAEYGGRRHEWNYASYEGRTRITAEMAKTAGIELAVAGPDVLRERLALYGSIQPNGERVRNVTARFPGVIRSVSAKIGDTVRAGQTLATVESNESLQTYPVTAPIGGAVTQRMANPGEAAGESPLFVVADFSSVWAEFAVFPRDRARLAVGQEVEVVAADGKQTGGGRIAYLAPTGGAQQTLTARVVLDNQDGGWTPGLFVTGQVAVNEQQLPIVVPLAAIQSFRDWQVAFINIGDDYEARPLELGRDDGVRVEVLTGLKPGEHYVVANSYLIKADIEKSGAAHDH
ncbi:MAG: efflux RND transporter periplasmic adaptor subunit [Nevskiales bacterium]